MATPVAPADSEPTVHLRVLLGEDAVWTEGSRGAYDLERILQLNTAIPYRQSTISSAISLVVSQNNAFIASLSRDEMSSDIKVIVYRTAANSLEEQWTSTASFTEVQDQDGYRREKPSVKGWISCDGRRMMVEYEPRYASKRMVTSDQGRTWAPFRMSGAEYDSHGDTSSDDNHIFFRRHGGGFRGGGQGEIVDVYSTTNWSRIRSWTFAFGDGRNLQNVKILPNLMIDKPVHVAISTSRGYDDGYKTLIVSSNGLQFQAATVDHSTSSERTWISGDSRYMVYLSRDDGKLHIWDLTNPTFKPLKAIQLPDVEVAGSITHIINGKPFTSKRAIPRQTFYCKFSPGNEVVSVIVANEESVVVLSFLTFNLQLVYKRVEPFGICPGHQVLQVRIGDSRGISLVGLTPVSGGNAGINGLAVTFSIMTGAWEDIEAVETYFDTAEATLRSIGRNPPAEKSRILHRWTISPDAITRQFGATRELTADETEHQLTLFNSIFTNDGFATYAPNRTFVQDRVIHLITITYPWDPESKVYVFAIRMKYDYSIVAMAVAKQVTAEPYLIRVLSTSENLYGSEPETVEILQNEPYYVLKAQGKADGSYSGIPLPPKRITIIGHHFMPNDAPYDLFIIKESTGTTMPSGGIVSPNVSLVFTANLAAYFPPRYMGCGGVLDYGHRNRANYVMPKFAVWLSYAHRSRRNEPFFGGGKLMDQLGENSAMVFDDPIYDDRYPLFPSGLATAATLDVLSNTTSFVDDFMKRFHQSDMLIVSNSRSISCSLPVVCRARPLGLLSFMRHIALFNLKLAENTAVFVSNRAHERRYRNYYPQNKFLAFFWQLFSLVKYVFIPRPRRKTQKANTTAVTIPLDGFCTYDSHIYGPLAIGGFENDASSNFLEMAGSAYYNEVVTGETARNVFNRFVSPSRPRGTVRTSPFTCLIEEVFYIDDHELQFSIFKVIWLEKLVYWKLKTFGQYVFFSRIILPSLANWILQFTLSILTSEGRRSTAILVLGGIQALICAYLITQKFRQARATRLFFRSFYNFMDSIAIGLSIANAILVLTRHTPPRPFVAYTTTIVWIDVILLARMYESAGILMILLTEMMKGVMPFLILLALFIVGFTFIPFLLLKDMTTGPFANYSRSLGEMITFMTNDFTSLQPFSDTLVSIQVLRAVFTILISILFLNSLIALLNLRVEAADKRSRTIWIRQMSAMIVEIERGILTARERKNPRWFPRWFTYNIGEDEKNQWRSYINKYPLGLGYGPDNSPNPAVAASSVRETATPEARSPTPQRQPTSQRHPGTEAASSSTSTRTPAEPPAAAQPSKVTRPPSTENPSISNPSGTTATSSTETRGNAATPIPQTVSKTQDINYTVTIGDEAGKTLANITVPGSVTMEAPSTQPSTMIEAPIAKNPDVSSISDTSSANLTSLPMIRSDAATPSSTVTRPTATHPPPSTKPPTPSGTSSTPLPAPAPTSTSQPQRGSTTIIQPSMGATSGSQGTSPQAASQDGERGEVKEVISLKCQICPRTETKLCSGCRSVRYCSEEHQKQDWAAHKKKCLTKARVK